MLVFDGIRFVDELWSGVVGEVMGIFIYISGIIGLFKVVIVFWVKVVVVGGFIF